MSARTYSRDRQCPHCGSNWLRKYGFSKGRQSYSCGSCHHKFTPGGNRSYYPEAVKRQALKLYGEGMSVSAISRVMDVKLGTVYSWVKKSLSGGGVGEVGAHSAVGGCAQAREGHIVR